MKKIARSSEFTKNILTLVSGTGLGQLITIGAAPILSRLFTPEEFVPLTLFTSIAGIISIVAAGRFELAILLPKKEEEAKSLVALCFILSLLTSLLTLLALVVYDYWLAQYWPTQNFNLWFYLLVPLVFILGAYKALNFWSTRHRTYKTNALGRILISLVIALLSVLFGFFDFVPGLIIAFVVGNLIGLIALAPELLKGGRTFFAGVSLAGIKSMFKKHMDFVKINVPHALVDTFQANGIVFFITYFFSETLVGLYGLSFRILKAPLSLIGAAYYQVFYQKVTQQAYHAQEVKGMVKNVYKRTFLIGIIPFTLNFFFAPQIFAFVFGEEWREAGVIAQIMTPWLFLNFMVSPVSCLPLIYNRQRGSFIIACVDVVCRFSIFIVAGVYHNSFLAFASLSIIGSLVMVYAMWWYMHIIVDKPTDSDLSVIPDLSQT